MLEENVILISQINDFVFCPISIYFHVVCGDLDKTLYQGIPQIQGRYVHQAIDKKTYSSKKNILQSIDVYSEEFNVRGKIDVFDIDSGVLTERKNKIKKIYDGYIFQVYAQYYALIEMGHKINRIKLHSMIDNKNYEIKLPSLDLEKDKKFRDLIWEMRKFSIEGFVQNNTAKCQNCIYAPICDRGLYVD